MHSKQIKKQKKNKWKQQTVKSTCMKKKKSTIQICEIDEVVL